MASLCSRKEYCEKEIRDKIKQYGIDGSAEEEIMNSLKKSGFIDNRRYAAAYAKDKFSFNNWGRIKISAMLSSKGIPEEITRDALKEIPEDEYTEHCARVIFSKMKTAPQLLDGYEGRSRLIKYAANKGFEYETIEKAIKRITIE